jgi:hypothetical protein
MGVGQLCPAIALLTGQQPRFSFCGIHEDEVATRLATRPAWSVASVVRKFKYTCTWQWLAEKVVSFPTSTRLYVISESLTGRIYIKFHTWDFIFQGYDCVSRYKYIACSVASKIFLFMAFTAFGLTSTTTHSCLSYVLARRQTTFCDIFVCPALRVLSVFGNVELVWRSSLIRYIKQGITEFSGFLDTF